MNEEFPLKEVSPEIEIESDSLIDRLRRQRKAVAEQHFNDVDIPGFNGELFCRYRLLDSNELDSIVRKVRAQVKGRSDQVFAITCDNLITACEEFYVRDGGKEVSCREAEGWDGDTTMPIRYDANLARFLGFSGDLPDPPTARSVVLGLFGGNDVAVIAHGGRLAQWFMKTGSEVDLELGEV